MKKILSLLIVLMAVVSVNAEETVLYEGSDALSWTALVVPVSQCSESTGITMRITIKTTSGDWWQVKVLDNDWAAINVIPTKTGDAAGFFNANDVTYSWATGTYTYDFHLTDDQITQLKKGLRFQGSGAGVTLTKVTIEREYKANFVIDGSTTTLYYAEGDAITAPKAEKEGYTLTGWNPELPATMPAEDVTYTAVFSKVAAGKEIEMDQWGQILSSAFNGLSDNAKITFTWETGGDPSSYQYWGAGYLMSMGGTVNLNQSFAISTVGTHSVSYTVAELKDALNAACDQYGRCGITWGMWGQGGTTCTNTRTSVIAYEVDGYSGTGYQAPTVVTLDETADNTTLTTGTSVNLLVKRSLKSDRWNSVCFPFSMTENECTSKFRASAIKKVADIANGSVKFEDATTIDAHSFYVIKPASDITWFSLTGKTLSNGTDEFSSKFTNATSKVYPSTSNPVYGIYSLRKPHAANDFYMDETNKTYCLSNNAFYEIALTSTETVNGYRWIVVNNSSLSGAKNLVCDLDDFATGIESVQNSEFTSHSSESYNIIGQRVNAKAKGLVIKNGKKFYVK